MPRTDPPTWYEELIRREHTVNENLATLCEKQQQLIRYLEGRLGEKGILEGLASEGVSEKPGPAVAPEGATFTRDIGPNSAPINWTGSTVDLIPVVMNGIKCKGLVLTPHLTALWKNLLQRDYMLKKHSREYHEEEKHWWVLNTLLGGATSAKQQIRIDDGLEPQPKYPGARERGYKEGQVEAWKEYSTKRLDQMDEKRRQVRLRFAYGRRELFSRITCIFREYEDFKFEKGKWLKELRESRSTCGTFKDKDTSGWDDDIGVSNEETDFEEPLGKGNSPKEEPEGPTS